MSQSARLNRLQNGNEASEPNGLFWHQATSVHTLWPCICLCACNILRESIQAFINALMLMHVFNCACACQLACLLFVSKFFIIHLFFWSILVHSRTLHSAVRLCKGMIGKNGWVKRTNRKCRRVSRIGKIRWGGGARGRGEGGCRLDAGCV